MARHVNKAGFDLVKEFEGCYTKAYRCPAGVWTIGYGHTKGVRAGDEITVEMAEALLTADLAEIAEKVESLITVKLTPNQFAALVSFTFNVGPGNLRSSTLRRKLNAGDHASVPSEMGRWVKATVKGKKVTLPGLVRRRAAEALLWLNSNLGEGGPMIQVVEHV